MRLDLKKLPFGQTRSRHLLFEETDPRGLGWEKGLYLALATESGSMFGGFVARSAGFILVTPTVDGAAAAYTAEATPGEAALHCQGGGTLRLAIDGPALLVRSDGPGLRLKVRLGHGETVSETPRGYELNMGATKYIIAARKGKTSLEVGWDLVGLHSTDPVLTLDPVDGQLDLVLWDTDATYELPEIAADEAAAAEKAAAAFQAFRAGLRGGDELAAYVLWLGYGAMRGENLLIANKIGDNRAVALEQVAGAMAMKEPADVIAALSAMLRLHTPGGLIPAWVKGSAIVPEAAPPLWGLALADLDWDTVPAGELAAFYELLYKAVGWWLRERSTADGACFYAYPHECGWTGMALLAFGEPAVTPDLAAYMLLNCQALSRIAGKLGRRGEELEWLARAERQRELLGELWDGGRFCCRSALGGQQAACRTALGLLPLALGKDCPEAIRAALLPQAAALEPGRANPLLAGLVALGCPPLAEKLARRGAEKADAGAGAAYDPAMCALLLALNERS